MKASVYFEYGDSSTLSIQKIDIPIPKKQEILVKVMACTVNRTDCAMLSGKPKIIRLFTGFGKPKKPILGTDFAGIIESVGTEVENFKVGDRVFGFDDLGLSSHAEFLCISEQKAVALIPNNISFENAAASLEGAHYAINFMNKVRLNPEKKALVFGASGAIGSAMVQLLRKQKVQVTAIGNKNCIKKFEEIGINGVLDFETNSLDKLAGSYDFVFDPVGKTSFFKTKHLLSKNGIYISSELGYGLQNVYLPLLTKFSSKKVKFPLPKDIKASIKMISELLQNDEFIPLIDKTYNIHQIPEAFDFAASGQKTGNLVIKIQE